MKNKFLYKKYINIVLDNIIIYFFFNIIKNKNIFSLKKIIWKYHQTK